MYEIIYWLHLIRIHEKLLANKAKLKIFFYLWMIYWIHFKMLCILNLSYNTQFMFSTLMPNDGLRFVRVVFFSFIWFQYWFNWQNIPLQNNILGGEFHRLTLIISQTNIFQTRIQYGGFKLTLAYQPFYKNYCHLFVTGISLRSLWNEYVSI